MLDVREGDRVEQGQLLLRLWDVDVRAELALAESEYHQAVARAEDACLRAELAQREADRQLQLQEQGIAAAETVDRAVSGAQAARALCRASEAEREVTKRRIEVVQARLARMSLTAPFAGIVAEVNAELGEFVTPSPPGIPTLPALDLIDASCLFVAAPIDEVDAPEIEVGMSACVSFDAFPKPRCDARVRRIAPYVLDRDKQARTVEVEVEFTDPGGQQKLLPGYSADVEVVLVSRDQVLRIPTDAVLDDNHVLVYSPKDGILERRAFVPGIANWRYTEIASGLEQGERVVVSVGREGVSAGARVVPESDSAASRVAR